MEFALLVRPDLVGARLRNARVLAKLTQDAAAKALGMARTTIVSIEAGKRPITSDELRAFAELYGVVESALLSEARQPLDLEVKFRSHVADTSAGDEPAVASLLNKLAASAIELEGLIGVRHASLDIPFITIDPDTPLEQQAEDAALSLRQRLGIGFGPIPDLTALIETDLGLRVFERPLPSKISGAVAYDETYGGFMLLNSKHPLPRRRKTASHEVCHPLIRVLGLSVLYEDDELGTRENKFCDAFARAFLMPAVSVRKKALELRALSSEFTVRHLLMMAIYFNVSIEAMTRRLEGLGLTPKGLFDSLREQGLGTMHLDEVRKELGEQIEPSRFTPRMWLLAGAAYDRELLSEQQIARMFELDLVTVRRNLAQVTASGERQFGLPS